MLASTTKEGSSQSRGSILVREDMLGVCARKLKFPVPVTGLGDRIVPPSIKNDERMGTEGNMHVFNPKLCFQIHSVVFQT